MGQTKWSRCVKLAGSLLVVRADCHGRDPKLCCLCNAPSLTQLLLALAHSPCPPFRYRSRRINRTAPPSARIGTYAVDRQSSCDHFRAIAIGTDDLRHHRNDVCIILPREYQIAGKNGSEAASHFGHAAYSCNTSFRLPARNRQQLWNSLNDLGQAVRYLFRFPCKPPRVNPVWIIGTPRRSCR